MKPGDLYSGLGQLTHAFAELNEKWGETKEHWKDSAARQFEELHLLPLPGQMKLLMTAIQSLQSAIDEAYAELEDKPAS